MFFVHTARLALVPAASILGIGQKIGKGAKVESTYDAFDGNRKAENWSKILSFVVALVILAFTAIYAMRLGKVLYTQHLTDGGITVSDYALSWLQMLVPYVLGAMVVMASAGSHPGRTKRAAGMILLYQVIVVGSTMGLLQLGDPFSFTVTNALIYMAITATSFSLFIFLLFCVNMEVRETVKMLNSLTRKNKVKDVGFGE